MGPVIICIGIGFILIGFILIESILFRSKVVRYYKSFKCLTIKFLLTEIRENYEILIFFSYTDC